jgi:hypothetical protein
MAGISGFPKATLGAAAFPTDFKSPDSEDRVIECPGDKLDRDSSDVLSILRSKEVLCKVS